MKPIAAKTLAFYSALFGGLTIVSLLLAYWLRDLWILSLIFVWLAVTLGKRALKKASPTEIKGSVGKMAKSGIVVAYLWLIFQVVGGLWVFAHVMS